MTQFHVYVDGEPTKGIFNTLQEAQEGYKEEIAAGRNVEIQTINSPAPMIRWYFDQTINEWVQGS